MTRICSAYHKIIKKIVGGDKTAMADFIELYGKLIYVTAKRFCDSVALVEDAFNQVLFTVWQFAEDVMEYEYPEAWLITVTENAIKNIMKTQWVLTDKETPIEEKGYIDVETEDEFNFCIKDLSDIEQEILTYKFVQDLTFDEIAHITMKSASTVSSIYYRALAKLKKNYK